MSNMNGEDAGQFAIDIGDFNHIPEVDSALGNLFPSEHTFRKNATDSGFFSTLDGCRGSCQLMPHAGLSRLAPVLGAQHTPILFSLNYSIDEFDTYCWARAKPIAHAVGSDWSLTMQNLFDT